MQDGPKEDPSWGAERIPPLSTLGPTLSATYITPISADKGV